MRVVEEDSSILIVMADHGNAEEMYQLNDRKKTPKTSHTTNKVPFIIFGNNLDNIKIKEGDFSLANVAATVAELFEIEPNPHWLESIIKKEK